VLVLSTEVMAAAPTEAERNGMADTGSTDENLRWAARIYLLAETAGDPPVKAVRKVFGLAPSTAVGWVKKARDQGLLTSGATP